MNFSGCSTSIFGICGIDIFCNIATSKFCNYGSDNWSHHSLHSHQVDRKIFSERTIYLTQGQISIKIAMLRDDYYFHYISAL